MNRIIPYFIITFLLLNIPLVINAQEQKIAYVSDVLILTVRKGPAQSFEIFKTIESDEKLLILEEKGNYSKVKFENSDIGWVQTQYLTFETPDKIIISRLNKKISRLVAKNNDQLTKIELLNNKSNKNQIRLENQKKDLEITLSESVAEKDDYINKYSTINKKYNTLLEKSKNVILTSNENKKLTQLNKELIEKLDNLESKNKTLFKVSMIKWFLAGAGVIFLGWLIGRSISSKGSRNNGLLR